MADNKNVYEIGLAMAGAISAGAYSAGVVDFLFQALHEWELANGIRPHRARSFRRNRPPPSMPIPNGGAGGSCRLGWLASEKVAKP
jgi:hypothetical protein